MSDEYTPTTTEILYAWAVWRGPIIESKDWFPSTAEVREELGAEFDRWLAGVERAAAEKAWDEGVTTALNYAKRQPDGITLKLETFDGDEWQNPYRKAVQS